MESKIEIQSVIPSACILGARWHSLCAFHGALDVPNLPGTSRLATVSLGVFEEGEVICHEGVTAVRCRDGGDRYIPPRDKSQLLP